jgi:hypothetical protein
VVSLPLLVLFMSTTIYEPNNRIEVYTPKGKGIIWIITDYGHETDTIYTVIQENGQLWQWTHKDIKVTQNITFGRINERLESNS